MFKWLSARHFSHLVARFAPPPHKTVVWMALFRGTAINQFTCYSTGIFFHSGRMVHFFVGTFWPVIVYGAIRLFTFQRASNFEGAFQCITSALTPFFVHFCSSSHNTYLLGAQIKGKSSSEMYRQVKKNRERDLGNDRSFFIISKFTTRMTSKFVTFKCAKPQYNAKIQT